MYDIMQKSKFIRNLLFSSGSILFFESGGRINLMSAEQAFWLTLGVNCDGSDKYSMQ